MARMRVWFLSMMLVIVAISTAAPFVASTAHAADKHSDKSRAHFEKGTAYFRLDKYGEALAEFEQAYLERQDPAFLFNIARCHREMGKTAEAIRFYRRFLAEAPSGHPSRAQAEQALREMEGTAALATPATGAAPPPKASAPPPPPIAPIAPAPAAPAQTAPPPLSAPAPAATDPGPSTVVVAPAPVSSADTAPHPIYKRWWFWTAVGAVVVGGIVIGAAAASGKTPDCPAGRLCY